MSPFPAIPDPPFLEEVDREWLGKIAVRALDRHCRGFPGAGEQAAVGAPASPGLSLLSGVFVTLFHAEDLRGCIGCAVGKAPLYEAVPRLAVAAASRDTRFPPVDLKEIYGLQLEITILGELTRLPEDPVQVLSGLDSFSHGIHVRKGERTGLFLPQVARKLDWGPRELLEQVSLKAGLGAVGWCEAGAELCAFTARSFAVSARQILLGDAESSGTGETG